MEPQGFERKNSVIKSRFLKLLAGKPDSFKRRLKFSWSNWGFGVEPLHVSCERLQKYGIEYIELHGNRYGKDLGYDAGQSEKILSDHGITVGGICGMFSKENDLSSNSAVVRQNALDYLDRNIELGARLKARYFLIVPGAVGRPESYDDMEFHRSVETLKKVSDRFAAAGIRGAVEPIRSAEVSFCHTFAHAKQYIEAVDAKGVRHISGDVYHMLVEESHIGEAIMDAGQMLTNLHMADTNRGALGSGSLDIDTIIMALYLVGYNTDECCFVTPEPLGPGGDPYPAMYGRTDTRLLDSLVQSSVEYFRRREDLVLGQPPAR